MNKKNTNNAIELSIIIPVYNEEGNIPELYKRLIIALENKLKATYEIIFVDDGSNDNSWNIIEKLHKKNKYVKGIKFSRNFGHDLAIKSGMDNCKGEIAICIDADLQHPPEKIPQIFNSISKEKFDIIFMKRESNLDMGKLREIANKLYYNIFRILTKLDIENGISDFFGINRKAIEVFKKHNEKEIFNRGIILSLGFNKRFLNYKAEKRFYGKSSYNIINLIKLAINSILKFSIIPLNISIYIGLLTSIISFIYAIFIITKKLIKGIEVPGWATVVFLILFIGGTILICLGIVGNYIAKIYTEVKQRPNYIIERKIGV